MSRWRAVVFDLDDTLYPEVEFVRSGFRAAARWAERTLGEDHGAVYQDLWTDFEAGVRGDSFDRWLRRNGHAAGSNREAMIEVYRTHTPEISLYPDVLPALAGLGGGIRVGLITEGRREVQQAKVAALGLVGRIEHRVVLGEDERAAWKPSAEPFRRWLAGLALEPGEVVYLGDNPAKDFLGARRAGWGSVRVRRPDGLHRNAEADTPQAEPDYEIESLSDLGRIPEFPWR